MFETVGVGTLIMLVVVAALVIGLAMAFARFRKSGLGRSEQVDTGSLGARGGRLEVLESTVVDGNRRLVLVRCDDVEHLIMVGGAADLVVQSGPRGGQTAPRASAPRDMPVSLSPAPMHPNGGPDTLQALGAIPEQRPTDGKPVVPSPETRSFRPVDRAVAPVDLPKPPVDALAQPDLPAERPNGRRQPAPGAQPPAGPVADRNVGMASGPVASLPGVNGAGPQRPPAAPGPVLHAPPPAAPLPRGSQPERAPARPQGPAPDRQENQPQPGGRPNTRPELAGGPPPPPSQGPGAAPPPPGMAGVPVHPNSMGGDAAQPNRRGPGNQPPPPAYRPGPSQGPRVAAPGPGPAAAGPGRPNRPPQPTREPQQPPSLPPAQIPWPEPGSPPATAANGGRPLPATAAQAGAGRPEPRPDESVRPPAEPNTTLGDLAERLEEALAREVHGGRRPGPGQPEYDLGGFGLGVDSADHARTPPGPPPGPVQPARTNRGPAPGPALPSAPAAAAAADRPGGDPEGRVQEPPRPVNAAPEPEIGRDARPGPDRSEEAPVISLNARRREPVDPLEDEMARLLGELTGDTTRR